MAINFPDSPTINDTHTVSDRTWIWTGTVWNLLGTIGPAGPTNDYVNGITAGTGVTVSGTPAQGWSPTVSIGQSVSTSSSPSFSGLTLSGDAAINGGDVTTTSATFNLVNSNTTTVNFAGAATIINVGDASGIVNFAHDIDVSGDISVTGTVDGRDIAADGTKLDGIESGAQVNTVDSVNSQTGAVVLDADDIDDTSTTNKFTTASDISKLAGIESGATADQLASDVPVSPTGNLASTDVQAALQELQGDIDTLSTLSAPDNVIMGNYSGSVPSNAIGNDGDYAIDISDGSVYGPKASGVWPSVAIGDFIVATNLGNTRTSSAVTITSSDGADTTISAADGTNAGVMTASDYSKLLGIEAGATADMTASEILTAIKTVDGSGTGLDADLLDGQHGTYYQQASTALTTSTSFGGDVSGTYDNILVADDSHNHIISNVDGLETALDGKVDVAGDTMTGSLTVNDRIISHAATPSIAARLTGTGTGTAYHDWLNSAGLRTADWRYVEANGNVQLVVWNTRPGSPSTATVISVGIDNAVNMTGASSVAVPDASADGQAIAHSQSSWQLGSGTVTGNLTISGAAYPRIEMKHDAGGNSGTTYRRSDNTAAWSVVADDISNLTVNRYSAAGAYVDTPLNIRNDGEIRMTSAASVTVPDATADGQAIAYDQASWQLGSGTVNGNVTVNGDILMGTGDQIDFADESGDKVYWWGNAYGTGIEGGTLTHWSATNHRFRIGGSSVSSGTQIALINSSGIDITGNITVSGTVDGVDIAALNTTVGTKLANIVEDTTPQLGGALDVNGNEITGAIDLHSTGDIIAELGDDTGTNKLSIRDSSGAEVSSIDSNGSFSAATKSFDIPHPTKDNMRLRYGSVEAPEHSVQVRGRCSSEVIVLPDYWEGLVDDSTITVQLTAMGRWQRLFVKSFSSREVVVGGSRGKDFFYTVSAERKDVPRLVVEYGD